MISNSFDNPKELKFVITLGVGTFGSGSSNQITLQGFTISNSSAVNAITVSAFSGQTISGNTVVAAGLSVTYLDTLTGAGTGGCYWTVK
jgi:hypothetical protein